jgi:hypothetical protein
MIHAFLWTPQLTAFGIATLRRPAPAAPATMATRCKPANVTMIEGSAHQGTVEMCAPCVTAPA